MSVGAGGYPNALITIILMCLIIDTLFELFLHKLYLTIKWTSCANSKKEELAN